MSAERSTATFFGIVGGLIASIVVAVVSTWLAAEANRTEALRQERRSAYADLIARAGSCESVGTFGFIREPLPRFPSLAELKEMSDAEVQELFDRVAGDVNDDQRRLLLLKECTVPLRTSVANVALLSESALIREAGYELVNESLAVAFASESQLKQRGENYVDALSRFQALAQQSATAPVISPIYIQLGGLVLIELILLFLAWRWRARLRTARRKASEPKDAEAE